jgi:hypothetical protein
LEVKPPKDNLIDWPELSATKGDDSVGISAHFMLIENSSSFSGIANTPTYFIQTDFKGKLLDVTEIPPPEKKKYIYFSPGKPGWNGVNWIVAGCYTKLSTSKSSSGKTTTIPASNALYVYAVPNKGVSPSKKIKLQKLFSDDQEEFVTYPMLYFLPKDDSGSPSGEIFPGAKQKGETLKLVASHVDFVSEENQELDSYTVNYYLIPINDVPKQAGIVVPIRIPDWEHKISFDTGMEIRDYTDVCSEYCMADQNHFYLAQTRFVKVAANAAPANPANGYVYENQFNLYYINTLNGLVQTIATGDLDAEGSWRHVVIGWFNGSVGVINQFTPSDYLTNGLHYYMTMIKP